MNKRLDNLFAALMLASAVAVLLAGGWVLARSISRAEAEPAPEPVQIAPVHIEAAEPLPTPTPPPAPEPAYDPAIPLDPELQEALCAACEEADVPVALALGVMEVESRFQADAVSAEGCYGLMQLNPEFFPDKLSPAENIRAGVVWLGELLERYGGPAAALTAYNAGHDTGARGYANAVLAAAEGWTDTLNMEAGQ